MSGGSTSAAGGTPTKKMPFNLPREVMAIFCIGGIYICYMVWGILQERVQKTAYNGEYFTYTLFLLFCQCLASVICGSFGLISAKPNETPIYKYGIFATTYLAAMFFSNYSLYYVDYPTQVLGKSCKPIPVMIVASIMGRRYPVYKWLLVLMIVAGVALFFLKPTADESGNSALGIFFLVLSLACDGFTGPFQDKVFAQYKPSSSHMIVYSNLFAVGYCLIGLVVTDQGYQAMQFCVRHPQVVQDLFWFSMCGAIGQHFIYLSIEYFGSLMCSIVTTTRKFFTILTSVLWFGHSLLFHQWIGVVLVFVGLGADSVADRWAKKPAAVAAPAKA